MPALLHATDFTAGGTIAAVAAGATLYDNWVDRNGLNWQVSAAGVVATAKGINNTTDYYNNNQLYYGATTRARNRIILRFPPWVTGSIWYLATFADIPTGNRYCCFVRDSGGKSLIVQKFSGYGDNTGGAIITNGGAALAINPVAGTRYTLIYDRDSNGTTCTHTVTLQTTSGGTVIGTTSGTDTALPGALSYAIDTLLNSVPIEQIEVWDLAASGSLVLSPSAISAGSLVGGSQANTVIVTGTGVTFTGSPFSLSGASGASPSLVSQNVLTTTTAALTIDAGAAAGTVGVVDSGSGASATLTIAANAAANQVFFLGDSITALTGVAGGEAAGMLNNALKILGPTWKGGRDGASGHCLVDGTTYPSTASAGQVNWGAVPATLGGRNVLVVEGGLNDFFAAVTGAQVYAYLRDVKLPALKAAGWKVVLTTLPAYNPAGDSGIIAQRPLFNNLIRNNWNADGFAGYVDLDRYAASLDANVTNNPYFYATDHVHPADPIHAAWGEMAAHEALRAGSGGTAAGGGFAPVGRGCVL